MDIQRKAELFVCAVLGQVMPGRRFLPSKGADSGGAREETPAVEVPYTAVAVLEAEDLVPGENTWLLTMAATYVTHIDDTQPAEHSEAVRKIQDVLRALPRGFHAEQQIIVHGAAVAGIAEVEDERKQSHGDMITFVIGCSG